MREDIREILVENERRTMRLERHFDPITGEGSIGEREELVIQDHPMPVQLVPREMLEIPLIERIANAGSVEKFVRDELHPTSREMYFSLCDMTKEQVIRIRNEHDFPFWCAAYGTIRNKQGGDDIPFVLNNPQRKLAMEYERQRLAGKPIRDIILKARQWGGSTMTQVYFSWIQLVHKTGVNSLIVAQILDTANTIKEMFQKLLANYPTSLLYRIDESFNPSESKFRPALGSHSIHLIPQRNCRVKVGTAEKPDSCRGESYTLVHCSEVGIWKETEGKTPEDIVTSATSGVLLLPLTMIVYESTAKGVGNFFHGEWLSAKKGESQFSPFFVGWHEIEQYRLEIMDRELFIDRLLKKRDGKGTESDREESGQYLWWLWESGATLEHIAWYEEERKKYRDHASMASEYPTDDNEAFAHSGTIVFPMLSVNKFRPSCRPPVFIGEISALADEGSDALLGIKFYEEEYGRLWVWEKPEENEPGEMILNRYLTVVDVGRGLSDKADFSVIVVFDRLMMMNGGRPSVVAQWYGKIDMDLLAWKSAQIAAWYNNSLLVIEANTLESNGGISTAIRDTSPYVLELIADEYPNLYMREQSAEDIRKHAPKKYGFHTNVKTKNEVIQSLIKVVREELYIERDERVLTELIEYEVKPNGAYGAPQGKHDDLLMTRAIGLHICYHKMPLPTITRRDSYRYVMKKSISEASI